jgi:hypothetical protein
MTTTVNLGGFDRWEERLRRVLTADYYPLMEQWEVVMTRDNTRGILAGQDKDGNPVKPVTYRPKGQPAGLTRGQRNGRRKNARFGAFAGFGPHAAGLNNNLTLAEYRKLDGPPLAPRRQFSRVITNFGTDATKTGPPWFVVGFWDDVVDVKGRPFLDRAFAVRDMRGVRPQGKDEARKAAVRYVRKLVRGK